MGQSVTARLEAVLSELGLVHGYAEKHQECKRKAVGVSAISFSRLGNGVLRVARAHNGPSVKGNPCSNMVGNCGCSHAEPRLMLSLMKLYANVRHPAPLILCCSYSPCTTCANIILDSGLISTCIYSTLTDHDKRGVEFLAAGGVSILTRDQVERALNIGERYGDRVVGQQQRMDEVEVLIDLVSKW